MTREEALNELATLIKIAPERLEELIMTAIWGTEGEGWVRGPPPTIRDDLRKLWKMIVGQK